jgi:hypothetical protein
MARTKRTPTARERIIEALKLGATHQRACAAAGIKKTTFYDWLARDPDFSEAVNAAEWYAAEQALRAIRRAAREGTWQAGAWLLERRYPEEYGRTIQEHSGGQKISVSYTNDWRRHRQSDDNDSSGSERVDATEHA